MNDLIVNQVSVEFACAMFATLVIALVSVLYFGIAWESHPRGGKNSQRRRYFIVIAWEAILLACVTLVFRTGDLHDLSLGIQFWKEHAAPIGWLMYVGIAYILISPIIAALVYLHIYNNPVIMWNHSRLPHKSNGTSKLAFTELAYANQDAEARSRYKQNEQSSQEAAARYIASKQIN